MTLPQVAVKWITHLENSPDRHRAKAIGVGQPKGRRDHVRGRGTGGQQRLADPHGKVDNGPGSALVHPVGALPQESRSSGMPLPRTARPARSRKDLPATRDRGGRGGRGTGLIRGTGQLCRHGTPGSTQPQPPHWCPRAADRSRLMAGNASAIGREHRPTVVSHLGQHVAVDGQLCSIGAAGPVLRVLHRHVHHGHP